MIPTGAVARLSDLYAKHPAVTTVSLVKQNLLFLRATTCEASFFMTLVFENKDAKQHFKYYREKRGHKYRFNANDTAVPVNRLLNNHVVSSECGASILHYKTVSLKKII